MEISLGAKIKALRVEKKLSQKDLCGDFINRVILSRIENNKMQPSFEQLKYIANKLETPISFFFNSVNHSEKVSTITDTLQNSSLSNLYKNQSYGEIIKLNEFDTERFNCIETFNKYYYLGMSYFNSQIYKEAIKPLRKFICQYNKSNTEPQRQYVIDFAIALNTLSKIMIRNRAYRKAKHYLLIAKRYLYKYEQNNSLIYSIIHNNLAYIYTETIEYLKVIYIAENFLNSRGNIIYTNVFPNIHISLSIAYYNTSKYEESIKHINKAIHLFQYEENYEKAAACYLNYINALRYSNNYDEAFRLLEVCKQNYAMFDALYLRFLIQELILYFNITEYDKVLELSKLITFNKLKKCSKCSFYFLLGHIYFLKNDLKTAYNYLLKCEDYFIRENFFEDLSLLYSDLYNITGKDEFKTKSYDYKTAEGRKNIIV